MLTRSFRYAWLPCLVATLVLVPFLGKAFTIDDTVFLFEAKHALTDPLHPTAFVMTWAHVPERVSAIVPTGPVMAWLLVPSILAGGSEVIAHAIQLGFVVMAVVATVSLAMRLGLSGPAAGIAGLLLAATPALLGMAGTAMPDVPAMALGVAGMERLVAWRDGRRWHEALLAALLLGLAAMTRTHAVLLLGVALLLLVEEPLSLGSWRRLRPAGWAVVAAGGAVAAALAIVTRDPAAVGGSIATAAASLSDPENVALNLVSIPVHWTLALPFGLAWLALRRRAMATFPVLAVGLIAGAAAFRVVERSPLIIVVPAAAVGAAALADALLVAWRRRAAGDLALAAWLLLPCPVVAYAHFPSKYLLVAAPAACVLVARIAMEQLRGREIALAVAAAGALLGVAILRADSAFAEVGRTGVRALTARIPPGKVLWYDGHWGFQWYAEAAGARCWTSVPPQPRPGDLILSSAQRSAPLDKDAYAALVKVGYYEDTRAGGRVMDASTGAGFFSNSWGLLPWTWGEGLVDAVDLWQAPASAGGRARTGAGSSVSR